MIKFLDLAHQYKKIKPEIDSALAEVIQESGFIGGDFVNKFELQFADYVGAAHCIGAGNGTDALEIAIEALEMPEGAEIIVPANSFIASSEAVTRQGFKVVFADCDDKSYLVSPADVVRKISPKTAAIVVVHLYGHPCDMGSLLHIAQEHKLKVIEDCAQAHGAMFKDQSVGSIGDIASFSFYPGKNLGAYGDGGAITTNSSYLAKRSRMIANHGRIGKYDHEFEGRNSRLDGLQAAILSVKLNYLDEWTSQRIELAEVYLKELADLDEISLPVRQPWAKQVYHLFVIRTDRRDALREFLSTKSISTGIHYPIALPKLPAYRYLNQDDTPTANLIDDSLLSLPIGDHLELDDAKFVADQVKAFFA